MGFYPKRLRSVKDLEREKELLLKEKLELEQEHFFSIDAITGSKKSGDNASESEGLGALLEFLPVSNPLVSLLTKMVQGWFSKKENKAPDDKKRTGKKQEKSLLKSIAAEFIGGYLKWKAIELAYKGIKYIIKRKP